MTMEVAFWTDFNVNRTEAWGKKRTFRKLFFLVTLKRTTCYSFVFNENWEKQAHLFIKLFVYQFICIIFTKAMPVRL
jgi:hypothetical protein